MSEAGKPALEFSIDDDGRLIALFDPAVEHAAAIDEQTVIDAIVDAGWGALWRDMPAIRRLAEFAGVAREPISLEVAERRDATCTVTVAGDAMSATLAVTPACGGAAMTRPAIDAALQQAGVVSGLLDDEIDAVLASGAADDVVIARGQMAQPGQPAEFRSLIEQPSSHGPTVDARGIADYRELGSLVTVHAGDALMRRIPARAGIAGEDVLGRVIPVAEAADPPFSAAIRGASIDAEDPDLLRADVSGQPVPITRGISVQPTISVPAVDLHSGNISADGTVQVRGDVAAGMQVRVTGDLFVAGTIEAATVEAGGSIAVVAGAIGHGDGRHHGRESTARARLQAGATVELRFAESAMIVAGVDLLIGEFALHCDLTAHERIIIGKPGIRRSQLIGGVTRAASLLQVGVLGSTAAVHTQVEVGYQPEVHARVAALKDELARNGQRLESLQQVLAYTETLTDAHHRELRERAQHSLTASEELQVDLLDRLAEAEARLVLSANPRIVIGQASHAGVEIRLGQRTLRTTDTTGPGEFLLLDGEIRFVAR